jgi:prefoldin subunit 5
VYEITEKVFGFRPPPDRIYNDLVAIRKIALKLRTNDVVQHLNFDYFTKRNIEINKSWIKKRKSLLQKLLKNFEKKLVKKRQILEQKLLKEINKLHCKRLKQLDNMMTKYQRCKNLLEEINSKEKYYFKTQKRNFKMRNDIPKVNFRRDVPIRSLRYIKPYSIKSDELVDADDIKLDETIRDRATGQTLMSVAQSVISKQKELLRRRTTIYDGLMKGIEESNEDLYSKME